MYFPAFSRYSPSVAAALQRIAEARAKIDTARILPAQEEILRRDALVGSVHYSNLIEGNELPVIEAQRALEHDLDPTTKAKLELVNYVAALEWIDGKDARGEIVYSGDFVKQLHGVMSRGLGRPGDRFGPQHEGTWRDGNVAVGNADVVFHVAPPHEEVETLMNERLDWLETKRTSADYFGPILAAIGHFEIAEVHPFADYNGRVARLLALAILIRERTITRQLFSPERYYAEDRDAYYTALRAIKRTRTLNDWLEYYVGGLAQEFGRVAAKVEELNRLAGRLGGVVQMSGTQETIVAELTAGGRRDITRTEVERLTGSGKTKAVEELTGLVEAGVLRPVGAGRRRVYELSSSVRLPRPAAGARGPKQRWTEERIRSELTVFARELGRWPSHRDFVAAGRMPLYVAASKAGGIGRWASEVGSGANGKRGKSGRNRVKSAS